MIPATPVERAMADVACWLSSQPMRSALMDEWCSWLSDRGHCYVANAVDLVLAHGIAHGLLVVNTSSHGRSVVLTYAGLAWVQQVIVALERAQVQP